MILEVSFFFVDVKLNLQIDQEHKHLISSLKKSLHFIKELKKKKKSLLIWEYCCVKNMEVFSCSLSKQHQKFCMTAKSLPCAPACHRLQKPSFNSEHQTLKSAPKRDQQRLSQQAPAPRSKQHNSPPALHSARESFKSFFFS